MSKGHKTIQALKRILYVAAFIIGLSSATNAFANSVSMNCTQPAWNGYVRCDVHYYRDQGGNRVQTISLFRTNGLYPHPWGHPPTTHSNFPIPPYRIDEVGIGSAHGVTAYGGTTTIIVEFYIPMACGQSISLRGQGQDQLLDASGGAIGNPITSVADVTLNTPACPTPTFTPTNTPTFTPTFTPTTTPTPTRTPTNTPTATPTPTPTPTYTPSPRATYQPSPTVTPGPPSNGQAYRMVVTGPGVTGGPHIRLRNFGHPNFMSVWGTTQFNQSDTASFFSVESTFRGGSTVAFGDVNGDGTKDVITGPGLGGGPRVGVFDGEMLLRGGLEPTTNIFVFEDTFRGGIFVAAGDFDADGFDDVVVGAGTTGGSRVTILSGRTLTQGTYKYGGLTISPPAWSYNPNPSPVTVNSTLNPNPVLANFFAYDSVPSATNSARFGVTVAAGDVNGDGRADLITGAFTGGGPHVKVFDGPMLMALGNAGSPNPPPTMLSFFAFHPEMRSGVYVAAGDVNHDGRADIIAGSGPAEYDSRGAVTRRGESPRLRIFNSDRMLANADCLRFFPSYPGPVQRPTVTENVPGCLMRDIDVYEPTFQGGVRPAAAELDGDGYVDVAVGPGQGGGPRLRVFLGRVLASGFPAVPASIVDMFVYDPNFRGGIYPALGTMMIPDRRGRPRLKE